MSHLGTPYTLKSLSLRNRIVMSPMCQYSVNAEDGAPNDRGELRVDHRRASGRASP